LSSQCKSQASFASVTPVAEEQIQIKP